MALFLMANGDWLTTTKRYSAKVRKELPLDGAHLDGVVDVALANLGDKLAASFRNLRVLEVETNLLAIILY